MQSCIQFSGSVVVVVLILSMAVNAGGQLQRGLCKEGCSELPEGRNCEVEHMDVVRSQIIVWPATPTLDLSGTSPLKVKALQYPATKSGEQAIFSLVSVG